MISSSVANEFISNRHYKNITRSVCRTQPLVRSLYCNIATCFDRIMTVIRLQKKMTISGLSIQNLNVKSNMG
jgi:hypothetical protein